MPASSTDELIERIDACHAGVGRAHAKLLRALCRGEVAEVWRDWGARDMAHWCAMRLGISEWKARRFLSAAEVLPELPETSRALESGELGIDKVMELARFATPGTEARLCRWAKGVSPAAVRHRADLEVRRDQSEASEDDRSRYCRWWHTLGGTRLGLEAELPAAEGAVLIRAIERAAEQVPVMPDEHADADADARRADGLLALAMARLGADQDPERATVVMHASVDALGSTDRSCELESGGLVHAETARRLLCTSRVQVLTEDRDGGVLGASRTVREPPAWMMRQLRHRDRECRYPGCGARRFTQAHHLVWVSLGGRTELDNLVLICHFHHKLVHEHGWRLERRADGEVRWFRPNGHRYQAGPAPPAVDAVA